MNGNDFIRIVEAAFVPFLTELGFSKGESGVSGREYFARFVSTKHSVSISFEPGDDALFVMVQTRIGGSLSRIDDRAVTPRLVDLNNKYMSLVTQEERQRSATAFKSIVTKDEHEAAVLKAAKELALVLPRYMVTSG